MFTQTSYIGREWRLTTYQHNFVCEEKKKIQSKQIKAVPWKLISSTEVKAMAISKRHSVICHECLKSFLKLVAEA